MSAIITSETFAAIEAARITQSQKNSIRRLLERMCADENYQPMVFTAKLNTEHASFVSVVIEGKRTDCEEFSPRMVTTAIRAHVLIGTKGGRRLADYSSGLTTYRGAQLKTMANIYCKGNLL